MAPEDSRAPSISPNIPARSPRPGNHLTRRQIRALRVPQSTRSDLRLPASRLVDLTGQLSNPRTAFARLCDQSTRSRRGHVGGREYVSAPDGPSVRQVQHRLTADQQAELLERYLAGERAFELAEDFRVHRSTVAKLLTDAGIRRSRSLTGHEIAECVELYAQGWSCERIGQRFGRNHGTIWLTLKAAGVQLRQPWDHLLPDPDEPLP